MLLKGGGWMTVFRKVLKVKTVGSRVTGDLRPAFSDDFVEKYGCGINYVVHEYNEKEGWCIVEVWCSDHPILPVEHQKNMSHLEEVAKNPHVIETFEKHPLSPPVLGTISYGSPHSPKKVDLEAKTLTLDVTEVVPQRGKAPIVRITEKTVPFKRAEKARGTDGVEFDNYILDEG
jgi:hypothetical protein